MDYFDEPVAASYETRWPELFEQDAIDPVVNFLADLAGPGPALELGIGTGRIALPLSQRGMGVHGIDLSPAMVARLGTKPGGDAVDVIIGDFATTRANGPFRLAYLLRNTIMNLTTQDAQVECFATVAAQPGSGGCFVIEVMVPELQRLPPARPSARSPSRRTISASTSTTSPRRAWCPATTGRVMAIPRCCRCRSRIWPAELDLMARLAGLTLRERWSGWHREPVTSDSTAHVSVWTKTA